jgi:prophage antirepressor-like protein
MTQIHKTLEFNGGPLRVLTIDGRPGFWFIAKDVCQHLGLENATQAVERLDEEDKGTFISNEFTDSTGRMRAISIVSEAGLYDLIMGSRKPGALAYKKWITHEVLPSLRETGSYHMRPQQPMSVLEGLSQQALILSKALSEMDSIRKTVEATQSLAEATQSEVRELVARHEEAEATIPRLPKPTEVPGYKTVRAQVNELIRTASILMNIPYQDLWVKAYADFRDRYKFDARTRARNQSLKTGKKVNALDILEAHGKIPAFYSVCYALYGKYLTEAVLRRKDIA